MGYIIRDAILADYYPIMKLVIDYNIKFDLPHLVSLKVVTDDKLNVVGFGSLVSLLEGTFLVDKGKLTHKDRVKAMTELVQMARIDTIGAKYDLFHAFTEQDNVKRYMTKHLGFVEGVGHNLVLHV